MFSLKDLSNSAIVLLIIMVFASVVTVRAIVAPAGSAAQTWPLPKVGQDAIVDPNMKLYIVPQDASVKAGDTFTVTIVAADVTEMYGWQAYMRFDHTMLEAIQVSSPSNSVFASSMTVSRMAAPYIYSKPTDGPLQKIQNSEGWILAGDCLLGANQPTFSGTGVLCQIQFKALSPGSTTLSLLHDSTDNFQTFNLNPDLQAITPTSPSYANINITSH